MSKTEHSVSALRDALLIEADYLANRAEWIATLAKLSESRKVLKRRLILGAGEMREQVRRLHNILAATSSSLSASADDEIAEGILRSCQPRRPA